MPSKFISDLKNFDQNIIPSYSQSEELFDNSVREETKPASGSNSSLVRDIFTIGVLGILALAGLVLGASTKGSK